MNDEIFGNLSGPSCSKLTKWLVNKLLKFQTYYKQNHYRFLPKNCEELLQCKSSLHFFSAKNGQTITNDYVCT